MKLLVTGGAGFIGANFVHYSLSHKKILGIPELKITVLDQLNYAGNLNNLKPILSQINFIEGDICDFNLIEKNVAKHDLIINFAAETHNDNSIRDPAPFVHSNILGTYFLLEAIRKHNKRYHHISTDEVFGDLPLESNETFTESSPYLPSSPYSATKAASDMLVRAWQKSFSIKATISNCTNNFGPYQHIEKFIPRQITNLLTGRKAKIYGNGDNQRTWIEVTDHIKGIWAVLQHGRIGETYLFGTNMIFSNLKIVKKIIKLLNLTETEIEFVPDRLGHDLKYATNSTKAQLELGWQPNQTNLDIALKNTINWYKNHKYWWEADKESIEKKYSQIEILNKQ